MWRLVGIVLVKRVSHGFFVLLRSDFMHLHACTGAIDLTVYQDQLAKLGISLIPTLAGNVQLTRLKGAPVDQRYLTTHSQLTYNSLEPTQNP